MNWISVKDRLPRHMKDVLVYSKSNGVWLGFYEPDIYDENGDIWFYLRDDGRYNDVTHWMPLPEPPQDDFTDDYIMPKNSDHRKQRGRTAPSK